MPIYEYRCSTCAHDVEALQKFSDAPLVVCPACGGNTLVKRVSAAGFHLKGSGWYATDFRGSGSKPAAKDDAKNGGDGATEAKSDAKSDAKSEAKSETKTETKSDTKSETKVAPTPATPSSGTAGS